MADLVNQPPHYTKGGVETIDFLEAKMAGWPPLTAYRIGNVLKYLVRHRDKGTALQDLKKARWYLEREIAARESEE